MPKYMKTTKQILIEARAVIALPEHWTQEHCARNAKGDPAPSGYDSDAVCWCSVGALEKVMGVDYFHYRSHGPKSLLDSVVPSGVGIIGFNDGNTHAEVLAAFDRAIESAE